jgi:phage gp29-like protein
MAPRPDLTEIGSTGLRRSSGYVYEEFLTQLRGRLGARTYREMADNDPVIGSFLFAIEKIITRLEWRVDPYSEMGSTAEPDEADVEVAHFVEEALNDMSESWDATLASILSFIVFGWSWHEIVYKRRLGPDQKDPKKRSKFNDGKIGWRKWPIRAQETWMQWEFDEDGGIQAYIQYDPSGGGKHVIPVDKSLLFRTTTQKNNPEGRSLLRNAYRPWYFKRRIEEIEAIGIERDLAGLPVAMVPPEYLSSTATPDQVAVLNAVKEIVTSIKRNENEGVIFPVIYDESGHKLFELTLLSSGGSRQFDTDKIIQRYDQRIAMSVLSDFILLGHDRVGSFALGTSKMDLWTMAVDSLCKTIADTVNAHAIPRLLKLNGMDTERCPVLVYSEVAHVDLSEIGDFVSKMTAAGVMVPDPALEDHLRDLAGLPPAVHGMEDAGGASMSEEDQATLMALPPEQRQLAQRTGVVPDPTAMPGAAALLREQRLAQKDEVEVSTTPLPEKE